MSHEGQIGVFFDSGGFQLLGTLFLAKSDLPKATAVILHGLPGIEKNYDLAHLLRDRGWNSLIFHYRGCWGSAGSYNFATILQDVLAAIDLLESGKHPQIDPRKIFLIGHSLGGWAAILTAAVDKRPRGVAVYAAVSDPVRFNWIRTAAKEEILPWLPSLTEQTLLAQWDALEASFHPLEQVNRLSPRPLLIIHGAADDVVPLTQSEQLHIRAGSNSRLLIHPTANHSFTWHRPWLGEQIFAWLEEFELVGDKA